MPRRRHSLRQIAASALLVFAGVGEASALSLPFEESDYLPPEETTTYVERSLNHQAPLVVEHPPVSPTVGGDPAAMAGFCHEGGSVDRVTSRGQVVRRQREVCDNVAPRTLWPGHTEPRPAWPAPAYERQRTLSSRG